MVFSSVVFLFLFLPATLAAYFIIPKKARTVRNIVLLVASLFFYFYGEPKGILVILISIFANYGAALLLERFEHRSKLHKLVLWLTVFLNLGLLGFYKYTNFAVDNINSLFGSAISIPDIIMPIGISFFTFQGLSYVFDVYRKTVPAQRKLLYVALYISLFPQLVAGPIVRYETVAQELSTRTETLSDTAAGFQRFVCGLAKKMLLANPLGLVATNLFSTDPALLNAPLAWMGAIAFSFQIYYDFSGYSDMAIGLGKIFGFHFLENFNYPYIARSITDFWRRWHMSLSGWFRDYVYIPLGGNRKGLPRQLLNILIVWALTGLWHGASWNFVFWGLYFAAILILEKLFLGKALERAWRPLSHIYSLLLILFGWVIFNCTSFSQIGQYLAAMFRFGPSVEASGNYLVYILLEYKFEFFFAALLSMPICKALNRRFQKNTVFQALSFAGTILLFVLSALSVVNTTFNPFIYFRF